MAQQVNRVSPDKVAPGTAGTPKWWGEQHASGWDRVKDAFRRDWEQTKADFTNDSTHDLHQNVGDTIKQAVGAAPVPPMNVKTHPDAVTDAEKSVEKAREKAATASMKASERIASADEAIAAERNKLNQRISDAEKGLEKEQLKASDKIADAQDAAVEAIERAEAKRDEARKESSVDPKAAREDLDRANVAIADEKAKLQEKVLDVHQQLANEERKAHAKILDARDSATESIRQEQHKVSEALINRDTAIAEWNQAEPGARYGYSARAQYATDLVWTPELEQKLNREWDTLGTGRSWVDSKSAIRAGWDYAARKR